jgi:[glutamine synthetase] adenylyltransferase / [glutamine synthetase]-adenylyl-L-tyrosine phosphorylase
MHKAAGAPIARALWERIREAPGATADGRGARELSALRELAGSDPSLATLERLLADPRVASFVAGSVEGSTYITGLIQRDPGRLQRALESVPEERFETLRATLAEDMARAASMPDAMSALRRFKAEVALLTALADLAGAWPLMQVTAILSETADAALREAVGFLFRSAAARGDWHAPDAEAPELGSGYIVLGMGKYGAHELNYSSDIDLIVFFDPARARVREGLELQSFFVRLTRDLVRLMHERTGEGYVFRTDLRLRPDAGATQIALSTPAALHYYEAFGQNWERAALIKARPVAGDIDAGRMLVSELAPFIWRKHLDFAAIADIHAMKRQIHAFRGLGDIAVAGHNIKLGRGGIREIEFFVQTQQLIAGGRQRDLRVPQTLAALRRLAERGWIKAEVATELDAAYQFLRRVEHRLQMVADEQTHELPDDVARLDSLARFCGYPNLESFSRDLVARLETVQRHYAALFEDMPELTAGGVNMVFAGEEDDPATVEALAKMGYSQPSQVIATVRGWHHGRYPAVRSARARERLTEVQPLLVAALADTADPDRAFGSFDRFLAELPGGVQLFALLRANPGLLRLVADIMGTAPRLARILSRRRRLLDAVLDPRTLATPSAAELDDIIAAELALATDFQQVLDHARIVGSEQIFLVGVRVLTGSINASQAGGAYALLAERMIAGLQREVERELATSHGLVPGGNAAVVAMGKLGGREMTAASDLDLIVVYEFPPVALQSDGPRPLAPTQYYARLTQRLVTALSSPTAEGALYDVDLRLRPSGQMGPVATQLSSFLDYQVHEAWTWEHLALTRARVVTGPPEFRSRVEAAIRAALVRPRDRAKIADDVRAMRQRISAEKGTDNIWDLKQVRGGLVDIEFIAQHLQLVHAAAHPEVLDQSTAAALNKLARAGLLEPGAADVLIPATRLLGDLTQILRLCLEGKFDPGAAPHGLKELLARAGDAPSFAALEQRLRDTLGAVAARFDRLVA